MSIPFLGPAMQCLNRGFSLFPYQFSKYLLLLFYHFIIIHQQMTNNERLKFPLGPAYGRPRFIQVLWSQHHWSQFNWHQQPCNDGSQIETYYVISGLWWSLFTILQKSTGNIGLFVVCLFLSYLAPMCDDTDNVWHIWAQKNKVYLMLSLFIFHYQTELALIYDSVRLLGEALNGTLATRKKLNFSQVVVCGRSPSWEDGRDFYDFIKSVSKSDQKIRSNVTK